MPPKLISKTRFTAGLQCEKRLWLDLYQKDLAEAVSPATQALFDQGHLVGELAQTFALDGVLIDEDHLHMTQAIQSTQKAVAAGHTTLFEAAAQTERLIARADILHRVKNSDEWDIIEIKSSTRVKEDHLFDLAFQKYVFEGAGYKIRATVLGHLNREYVRQGPLDIRALFTLSDQTEAVNALLKNLPASLKRLLKVADLDKAPDIPIGPHCDDPYDCPFMAHCWKDVPAKSVFTLAGRKNFVWDLYRQGTELLVDIPETVKLTSAQRKQIAVARDGKTLWKIPAIKAFLDSLEYPLSFLDFETVLLAIPPFDGCRAFDALPTQFSLHTISKPGASVQHEEFLADGTNDPRQPFAEALLKAMPSKGSILIYSPYENRILKETAAFLPKFKTRLLELVQRTKDLAIPFRQQQVLHPDFEGSYSIKAVLPALVPGMSYAHLAIGDGNAAVGAYIQLMDPKVTETAKKKIRKDLLVYCGQDTLAMVKLVEVLREAIKV